MILKSHFYFLDCNKIFGINIKIQCLWIHSLTLIQIRKFLEFSTCVKFMAL